MIINGFGAGGSAGPITDDSSWVTLQTFSVNMSMNMTNQSGCYSQTGTGFVFPQVSQYRYIRIIGTNKSLKNSATINIDKSGPTLYFNFGLVGHALSSITSISGSSGATGFEVINWSMYSTSASYNWLSANTNIFGVTTPPTQSSSSIFRHYINYIVPRAYSSLVHVVAQANGNFTRSDADNLPESSYKLWQIDRTWSGNNMNLTEGATCYPYFEIYSSKYSTTWQSGTFTWSGNYSLQGLPF